MLFVAGIAASLRGNCQRQHATSEQTLHACPSCGEKVAKSAKLCRFCRATLTDGGPAPQP
jgi:hypothetical protein